jgi:hypothetical protein
LGIHLHVDVFGIPLSFILELIVTGLGPVTHPGQLPFSYDLANVGLAFIIISVQKDVQLLGLFIIKRLLDQNQGISGAYISFVSPWLV